MPDNNAVLQALGGIGGINDPNIQLPGDVLQALLRMGGRSAFDEEARTAHDPIPSPANAPTHWTRLIGELMRENTQNRMLGRALQGQIGAFDRPPAANPVANPNGVPVARNTLTPGDTGIVTGGLPAPAFGSPRSLQMQPEVLEGPNALTTPGPTERFNSAPSGRGARQITPQVAGYTSELDPNVNRPDRGGRFNNPQTRFGDLPPNRARPNRIGGGVEPRQRVGQSPEILGRRHYQNLHGVDSEFSDPDIAARDDLTGNRGIGSLYTPEEYPPFGDTPAAPLGERSIFQHLTRPPSLDEIIKGAAPQSPGLESPVQFENQQPPIQRTATEPEPPVTPQGQPPQDLEQQPPEQLPAEQPPEAPQMPPAAPSAAPPAPRQEAPRDVSRMPRITEEELGQMIDRSLPPVAPHRFGLTPDEERALSALDARSRQAQEEALVYRWQPQFQETPFGRHWRMPATGETGFVPTPRFDRIRVGEVETPVVIIPDRFGRTRTYVLEPGTQSPGFGETTVTREPQQAPTQQPRQSTEVPNLQSPNAGTIIGPDTYFGRTLQALQNYHTESASRTTQAQQLGEVATQPIRTVAASADAARSTLSILEALEQVFNTPAYREGRVMTGALAERWLEFTRTVNGTMRVATGHEPFDTHVISASEALQKLNTFLGSSAARELTNRPTQFDFQAFLAANPGLSASPEGARIMAGILRLYAQRNLAMGNAATEFAENRTATGRAAGFTRQIQGIYDQHNTRIADMMLNMAHRGEIRLPIGFRYNGRQYTGGPINQESSWRSIAGNR